eukprot:3383449-Amphidinium_carterae.3
MIHSPACGLSPLTLNPADHQVHLCRLTIPAREDLPCQQDQSSHLFVCRSGGIVKKRNAIGYFSNTLPQEAIKNQKDQKKG